MKNKLTPREQAYYDAIQENGITPILSKDLYNVVNGEEAGKSASKIADNWVSRIRAKLGPDAIVNRHGFGNLTKDKLSKSS
jgi:hypothetical protein